MTGNQTAFDKAISAGHSAAWEQNWQEAARYYRRALDEFPDHPTALTSLGLAMYEMRDMDAALECYQLAAGVSPEDPMPVEKMARIYERLGRLPEAVRTALEAAELYLKARNAEKAIENWVHAISMQPENYTVRARLAMVYERMGRKEDAVAEYIATASLLQHANQAQRAMQILDMALKLAPDHPDVRQAMMQVQSNSPLTKPGRPRGGTAPVRMASVREMEEKETQNQPQKAMDPIAEARQKALVELANLLFEQAEEPPSGQQDNRGKGLGALTRGTGSLRFPQPDTTRITLHIGQAIESQSSGDEEQAAQELERAVEAGLNSPAVYFDLGLLRAGQQGQRALRHLQRSVKNPDFALASYLLIAQIYQREGNFQEAATAYLQALKLADATTVPGNQSEELMQLYEPIIEAQTHKTSAADFKKLCETIAAQVCRRDWRSYLATARQQMPASDSGLPVPLAEMLLESNSGQVVDALGRIRDYESRRQYRAAMEEAFNSLNLAPTYLPIHTEMGEVLLREERNPEAVEKFLLVAELYALRGEAAQAIRLLRRVTRMAPMELKVRDRLIELLSSHGQVEEALQEYWDLADMYYHLSELDQARQTYTNALRLAGTGKANRSWSLQILYKIADIDMQCLDWRQAVRIYEQARTLEPGDEKARLMLVDLNLRLNQDEAAFAEVDQFNTSMEQSGRRNVAIAFMEKLVNEYPSQLEMIKRLADLYVRNAQVPLAVKQLDRIADALLEAGNRDAAMAMLRTIIQLNPPNVSDYQAALKELKDGRM